MIANLIYDALTMCYMATPTQSQVKGALISDISLIEVHLGKEPIDEVRFNELMELPLTDLQRMADDQSLLLDRIKNSNNTNP